MRIKIIFSILLGGLILLGASAWSAKSIDKIKFPALSEPQMPDIESVTLDNGIRIYLIEDHDFPLVKARVRLAAGGYLDPADKVGLADITGSVLRTGGTVKMTGDEIDEKLESLGATVETGIGATSGSAYMNILSDYTDVGLEILADVLRTPVFDQDKIELAKTEQKSAIARRNDDAWDICFREFQKKIYGAESPYARHTEYSTINAVTREDLLAFHKQFITPENVMIAVWGDFNKTEMLDKLKKYFGDWPKGSGLVPALPQVDYKYQSSLGFIDKKNINQSKIRIGHIGGLVTDPDYHATIVMNNILGASFGSRLFNNVRSKQGLAYSTGGVYRSNISYPGYFFSYCFTKSESTVDAIKSIIKEIRDMQTVPPTEAEMRMGKDSYLNSFVFNFEDKADILDRMMTYDYYGLPRDFIFKEKEMVEKVTAADVIAAAQKRLHPDALHIMVVGNGDEFGTPLSSLGTVETLDVSIPSGEGTEAVAITPESLQKGKEFMLKAVTASGGIENFKKIKSTQAKMTLTLITPQGEFSIKSESFYLLPDKSRDVMTTPMGEIISVTNGDKVWTKQGPAVTEGNDEQVQESKKDFFRNTVLTFQHLESPDYKFAYLGQDQLDGKPVELIQVASADGVMKYKLALDAATFMPAAKMYFGQTMMGPGNLTEKYSDFKTVGGVKLPHMTKIESDGNPVANVEISNYTVNVAADETLFAKPQ